MFATGSLLVGMLLFLVLLTAVAVVAIVLVRRRRDTEPAPSGAAWGRDASALAASAGASPHAPGAVQAGGDADALFATEADAQALADDLLRAPQEAAGSEADVSEVSGAPAGLDATGDESAGEHAVQSASEWADVLRGEPGPTQVQGGQVQGGQVQETEAQAEDVQGDDVQGEEFAGSGLSAFPSAPTPVDRDELDEAESLDADAGGEVSGSPPASLDETSEGELPEAAPSFDDGAGDSTPLYRTLRERLEDTLGRSETSGSTSSTVAEPDPEPQPEPEPEPEPEPAEHVADPEPPTRKDDELMSTQQSEEVLADVESVDPAASGADDDAFPVVRVSELHEVVDGGFGIGSAAPIADGAQPLGHPIKANIDTKTYQDLSSPWYAQTQPDVWFLDVGFAERAGFHRAE